MSQPDSFASRAFLSALRTLRDGKLAELRAACTKRNTVTVGELAKNGLVADGLRGDDIVDADTPISALFKMPPRWSFDSDTYAIVARKICIFADNAALYYCTNRMDAAMDCYVDLRGFGVAEAIAASAGAVCPPKNKEAAPPAFAAGVCGCPHPHENKNKCADGRLN